jgi:two-component system, NtrC family, response regulator AtoC
LSIPPLRERVGQIGPLALHFLRAATARSAQPMAALSTNVLAALEGYSWPGNVRELKAVIERALLLARGNPNPISVRHLVFAPQAHDAPPAPPSAPSETRELALREDETADRERIIRALDQCAGNQTRAAKLLGISRSTLINKVRIYRIPRPRSE